MPLKTYSLMCGKVVDVDDSDRDNSPHLRCKVEITAGNFNAVSINMASTQNPPNLLVRKYDNVDVADLPTNLAVIATYIAGLENGLYKTPKKARIDYIKGLGLRRSDFTEVPALADDPDNDLFDWMTAAFRAATATSSRCFFFGERWSNKKANNWFTGEPYEPDVGVHDIHMNQGNAGHFSKDNGTYQDGAFLILDSTTGKWTVFLSSFQSQKWDTDGNGFSYTANSRF